MVKSIAGCQRIVPLLVTLWCFVEFNFLFYSWWIVCSIHSPSHQVVSSLLCHWRTVSSTQAAFDHTVRGALSPPHTSRALESASEGQARDRDSRAALGNPQDTSHILLTYSRRIGLRRGPKAKLPCPTPSIFRTSQPWFGWQAVTPGG